MDKTFNHKRNEAKIYQKWVDKRYFSTHDFSKKPFTILLPPPNITGQLHIGHALDSYLPDTINRFYKLRGRDVFFIAAQDHAGIATQSKVEQLLVQQGTSKQEIGRENFIKECYKWKDIYSLKIRSQWQALGLSLDLENERFTLDQEANEAVSKAFVNLYEKGYIYRDNLAINWDPKLRTALSNIEVINKETSQDMVYIKYFIENSTKFIEIATVRTETLYSDVAIVFNPKDKRFTHLKNKYVIHPLLKTRIPILEDEHIDPQFGTGLMKLSAHSITDIDIIKKHNLPINETIDDSGILYNANQFSGLSRLEARDAITEFLEQNGFVTKIDKTTSNVGYSERSNEIVEVLVRPQWFVKMNSLAKSILDNLKSVEAPKFYPSRFTKVLKQWMENIHDWTISRQLWWGHRIPAWFKNDQVKVQINSPGEGWIQDNDVLDTWFSSGLSSFVFLGWPQTNDKINHYYPIDLLVTGRDLIFFWIARMYFFSLHFLDVAPFKDILLHGLVRDEQNRKMSKSLGNGIDPLKIIDKYGSDSLRWALISGSSGGNDLRIGNKNFENSQAVITKLWNVARYVKNKEYDNNNKLFEIDKWILNKLHFLNKTIEKNVEKYEFSIIGKDVENYIFNELSSWYIEISKGLLNKKASLEILEKTLIILHPFFPFVTDYIYQDLFNKQLLEQKAPTLKKYRIGSDLDYIIEVVKNLRTYRQLNNISVKEPIKCCFSVALSNQVVETINKMANIEIVNNNGFLIALSFTNIYISITEEQQKQRIDNIKKQIRYYQNEVKRSESILNNKKFIEKAPIEKVSEEKNKYEIYKQKLKEYQKELECN